MLVVEIRGKGGGSIYVDVEEGEESESFVAFVVFSSFPAQVSPFNE
jgi:hypothetical protein